MIRDEANGGAKVGAGDNLAGKVCISNIYIYIKACIYPHKYL